MQAVIINVIIRYIDMIKWGLKVQTGVSQIFINAQMREFIRNVVTYSDAVK